MTQRTFIAALVTSLAALSTHAGIASAQDTQEARREAALRYARVAPMAKLMEDGVTEISKQIPEGQRAQFAAMMQQSIRIDELERAAIDAMVEVFTAQELNALADFYGSPIGQSAMGKFGVYMAEVMPFLQQELMRAAKQASGSRR
jgi:hypothetical protein